MLLATAALSLSAHGDELETPPVGKLTPQMQARLLQLLRAGDSQAIESAQPSGSLQPLRMSPVSTALRTGSLRTGRLATSGSLTGAPRLNDDEWRQLFPQRK